MLDPTFERAAAALTALHAESFGGKPAGRYRLPEKLLRRLLGRRRLYSEDIAALARALYERGFVLIDMDSFYVVLSANAFVNYRRANEDSLAPWLGTAEAGPAGDAIPA